MIDMIDVIDVIDMIIDMIDMIDVIDAIDFDYNATVCNVFTFVIIVFCLSFFSTSNFINTRLSSS